MQKGGHAPKDFDTEQVDEEASNNVDRDPDCDGDLVCPVLYDTEDDRRVSTGSTSL
jgi:hypothetical protein